MSVEILNIDCLEYMSGLDNHAFDLAIVDLSYRIGMDKGVCCSKKSKSKEYSGNWYSKRPNEKYFSELMCVSKNQIVWDYSFSRIFYQQVNIGYLGISYKSCLV